MASVSDYFADDEDYEEVLEKASRAAQGNERADEFVDEMIELFEQYGRKAFISESQMDWLQRLADS